MKIEFSFFVLLLSEEFLCPSEGVLPSRYFSYLSGGLSHPVVLLLSEELLCLSEGILRSRSDSYLSGGLSQ